jgi:hypothetical protein
MAYRLERQERERVILDNAASREWNNCTADPRIIPRMEKQSYNHAERANPRRYASFHVPFGRVRIARAKKSGGALP